MRQLSCKVDPYGIFKWTERADGAYAVHDWLEHNPWAAHRAERKKAAQDAANIRWARARNAAHMPITCEPHADGNTNRMRNAMPATRPNPTQPDPPVNATCMPTACEAHMQLPGFNSTEVAQALCSSNGWSGKGMIWALQEAIDFQSAQMPEASLEQVGEWLVKAYFDRLSLKGDFAGTPQKFFEQALYRSGSSRQANGKATASSDDLVARTVAQLEAK